MAKFSGEWSRIAIVTDDVVNHLYGNSTVGFFSSFCQEVIVISIVAAESSKSRQKKEEIEDRLLQEKFDRQSLIVALGGGVVGDLAGFVAATFLRGIDYVNIPTTLLAMIDSSIGGKCGVNTQHGKNLIGSIYPPKNVLIHPSYLKSLPACEIKCGMAEMIKAALIGSRELFDAIERGTPVKELIYPARKVKEDIVARDEFERGERRSLNFGHTVAHSLEKLSSYQIPHGACVWFGLLVESKVSQNRGLLSSQDYMRIETLLKQEEFSFEDVFDYDNQEIYRAMLVDKKNIDGNVRMCFLEEIGKVADFDGEYCDTVSKEEVDRALSALKESKVEV